MTTMRTAAARGIPMQINTMVTAQTLDDLPAIYEVLKDVGIARWALFFLSPHSSAPVWYSLYCQV